MKPRVGAGGRGVIVVERGLDLGLPVGLEPARGPWVVQPVVESVLTEGELRAAALEKGWGVLAFGRPVSLRSALTSRPALAVAGAVTIAGAGAVVWRALRRRGA